MAKAKQETPPKEEMVEVSKAAYHRLHKICHALLSATQMNEPHNIETTGEALDEWLQKNLSI